MSRQKKSSVAPKCAQNKSSKAERKREKLSFWKILGQGLPLILCLEPGATVADSALSIAHGISWGVVVWSQQMFFDAASQTAAGQVPFETALWGLLLMVGCSALSQFLNGAGNFHIGAVLWPNQERGVKTMIFRKAARLSPSDFEDTEKLDYINKAIEGAQGAIQMTFIVISIATFYVPYLLFMSWYLFSLKPVLALSILLVFVPTAATQLVRAKVFAKTEDETAPLRRQAEHYESCMVGREFFKETRLWGGFTFFAKLYRETLQNIQRLKYTATMRTNRLELLMRFCTVLGYTGILLLLFDALMKQEITVGAFAAVFNSIGSLYGIMEEIVCRHIGDLSKKIGTVGNFIRFLELPEREGAQREAPGWGDIVLEHVSFSYPHSEKRAVEDVSFTLKKGQTLAVVGENGSGKSTLVRLISGLYTPTEGRVLHNSRDTRELSTQALFKGISAVFQNFQKYQLTLSENLSISAPEEAPEEERLSNVCGMAGLEGYPKDGKPTEAFPEGYETMLSREFGGVDLSGGQWQRVAIARGYFRPHNTILLDEPTAAIDPYEETRLYNRFAELSKDASSVIVTHRLGSVKLADRILVMKEGRLLQEGTHEELLSQEGEYRRLYEAQKKWYEEGRGQEGFAESPAQ